MQLCDRPLTQSVRTPADTQPASSRAMSLLIGTHTQMRRQTHKHTHTQE